MVISSMNNYASMQKLQMAMIKMSSGTKINSAADDAAGLSISQKMLSQSNGYSQANENAADAQNASNVAEGGLSGIEDSLQRIRELSVKAGNGIYSDQDRAMMQKEIDQEKASITDQVKGTEFNTIKMLDNNSDINLAINSKGNGMSMKMVDTSLETLGIADYDVTKNFSIDAIDKAIAKVTSARNNFGTTSNILDKVIDSNDITNHNLMASMSKITDTDYAKSSTDFSTQSALNQYNYMASQANIQQFSLLAKV
ncbi:flagellin [Clostridium saccharoperbutylacetonicum]|uniref:Flagellin n=1 Tax=Clostridium saccharoperbutylacetonicum N1-4(HMT) TaxID=931276 RepID=M1MY58_9CLOT|nr:flagellin [Clostridium saccharoperbutylacetonicum]AGF56337.1 flagellin [Clostridium saccharoperbutylacetonicum N1-4(HMT)]NRT62919.1 flagellin [Clostridium saccharoperbutylacetonicum]NSB26276.1 flagellin [Clostridium saccharoperbutylacetonicum]NSB45627.1 flagellin [Clostridium saccharoperbutylacetonicum]